MVPKACRIGSTTSAPSHSRDLSVRDQHVNVTSNATTATPPCRHTHLMAQHAPVTIHANHPLTAPLCMHVCPPRSVQSPLESTPAAASPTNQKQP